MCSLAATGADGPFSFLLLALGLFAIAVGVLLVRHARGGVALLLVALIAGGGVVSPPSAQAAPAVHAAPAAPAACPPAAPPAPPAPAPATIGLIIGSIEFRLVGASTSTLDVTNLSATETAFDVTLVGAPPAGVTVDASACATILPGASCSILVVISGAATPFLWSYDVAGSNTNTIADSLHAWASTTVALGPPGLTFTVPGDSIAFVLTNTGAVNARLPFSYLGGSDPGAYSISSTTCGIDLAPGDSCTISVTYGLTSGDSQAILGVSVLNADPVTLPLSN